MKESKFAFIASHPGEYGVSDMCRALGSPARATTSGRRGPRAPMTCGTWSWRGSSATSTRPAAAYTIQVTRKAQDVRRQAGIRPSMGSISSPWDNAVTESLMGVIKSECVHARTYDTREQAALDIFDYIECFYNRIRIHSALGWLSPAQFEERMAMRNRPEAA